MSHSCRCFGIVNNLFFDECVNNCLGMAGFRKYAALCPELPLDQDPFCVPVLRSCGSNASMELCSFNCTVWRLILYTRTWCVTLRESTFRCWPWNKICSVTFTYDHNVSLNLLNFPKMCGSTVIVLDNPSKITVSLSDQENMNKNLRYFKIIHDNATTTQYLVIITVWYMAKTVFLTLSNEKSWHLKFV